MGLEKLLRADLIDSSVAAEDWEGLFSYAAKILVNKNYVTTDYGQQLNKRELEFPTGLATKTIDVAIPHTDAAYVKEPFIFVLKPQKRILFHQMGTCPGDNIMVRPQLIFILGFSKNDMQLMLLQILMQIFNEETIMQQLIDSPNEKELFNRLREQIILIGGATK